MVLASRIVLLAALCASFALCSTFPPEPTRTDWYTTKLDHFGLFDSRSMKLRWLEYDGYVDHSKPKAIFFYTGNEGSITNFWANTGNQFVLAKEMNAVVVFVEHRYYGKSLPFGDKTSSNPHNYEWLSSEQALMDFAEFLDDYKKSNPEYKNAPVVTFGGSYGGMLAAWMRIKYPHVIAGAISASAPVALFRDISDQYAYNKILEKDYTCAPTLAKGQLEILDLGRSPAGLSTLTNIFKTCKPLKTVTDLMDAISSALAYGAMVNYPYPNSFLTPLPAYPVTMMCDKAATAAPGTHHNVVAIQKAINVYYNYTGSAKCLDVEGSPTPNLGAEVWNIQACNEMVFPTGSDGGLFPKEEFSYSDYARDCRKQFGLTTRPDHITHMYGGRRIGVGNIVFSQGSFDPWTAGCINPEDVAHDPTLVVVRIEGGAHHLDLRTPNAADPQSVRDAREVERREIHKWIGY